MPLTFSFDWKSFLCLALKGYLGCSAGAVIWQGNRLALLLLLSGPVVLLISCLHSSRAVSLPPEHGVRPFLSRGWWGLQRAGITSVLSAPRAHRLVCQPQKLWPGKEAGKCCWRIALLLFPRMGSGWTSFQEAATLWWWAAKASLLWCKVKSGQMDLPQWHSFSCFKRKETLDINLNRTCLKYLSYFLNALSGQSVKQKQFLQSATHQPVSGLTVALQQCVSLMLIKH